MNVITNWERILICQSTDNHFKRTLTLRLEKKPMTMNSHVLKKWIKKWFDSLPLSDEQHIRAMYLYKFQRLLNLTTPRTFNEKIHWLNLSGYLEKYTSLVDKYAVREYVSSRIGSQYLNELYGVYNNEAEIDFGVLPHKFILKATHGSNWNIFCEDKNKLDLEATRRQLGEWLKTNYYTKYRETPYKNIPPKIICERLLEGENQDYVTYYKFLSFNGRVQFIRVVYNWFAEGTDYSAGIYHYKDWGICPFRDNPFSTEILEKPKNLEEMKEIAEALADRIPFVRVDLFNVNTTILFGEMTFTPNAGFGKIRPPEWDYILGTYLNLPVDIN